MRVAAEEFLLAIRFKKHDELAAEFIRSFRHCEFPGKTYLTRYEAARCELDAEVSFAVPKGPFQKNVSDDASLYGFRSTHPNIFFLSPWEFWQWYFVHKLRAPTEEYGLTCLTMAGMQKKKIPLQERLPLEPGVDFPSEAD